MDLAEYLHVDRLWLVHLSQLIPIDLGTLHPLDKKTILNSVQKTGKLVIVHEENLTGSPVGENVR